jgi:hypothetical protein
MESGTTTTPTDTGASNASDFQPPTRNPQDIPANLFQQQEGLQGVTNPQEKLNDQKDARISVTTNPADPGTNKPPSIEGNSAGNIGLILVIIAAIVVGLFLRVVQLRSRDNTPPMPELEPIVPEADSIKPKAAPAKTPKKAKKSKKKKRARK